MECALHQLNSQGLAPPDFCLFPSMTRPLSEQDFNCFESVKQWLDDCGANGKDFCNRSNLALTKRWRRAVDIGEPYFELKLLNFSLE